MSSVINFRNIFILILIFFPIQSVVISNAIKGLTLFNVLTLLVTIVFFFSNRKFFYWYLLFIFSFIVYFSVQGIFNSIIPIGWDNQYAAFVETVSKEPYYYSLLRKSFITQSIYLLVVVSFFILALIYQKKYSYEDLIKYSFLAMWIFILYGWYEFFAFLITKQNPDFLSNRIAGEDFKVGIFQVIHIGGLYIQRIKSLAGEPSMFAYTVIPFFIFAYYLKRKVFAIVSLLSLVISTSTTALLGLFLFLILDLIIFRENVIKKLLIYISTILFSYLLFKDFFDPLISYAIAKISLETVSGLGRFYSFYTHFNAWLHSDIFHIIFGYGWGYVRSTDGISTLLFNVGLIGTLAFISFLLLPYLFIEKNTHTKALFIANTVTCIIILISVPEFYYPHIWLFAALFWYKLIREKGYENYL